jgi:hypothetical protein
MRPAFDSLIEPSVSASYVNSITVFDLKFVPGSDG